MFGLIAATVVGTAVSALAKSRKPPRRIEAPEPTIPKNELGASIPIVFNQGKVGGLLVYSTPPYKVTDVLGGKGGRPKEIREDYQVDYMVYLLSSVEPVDLERLDLNGEVVYVANTTDPNLAQKSADFLANNITFFNGFANQSVSSELESLEGVGNVPAFNYISYIILKDLRLSRYGNTYPAVHATLKSQTQYNLGSYLRRIIDLAKVNIEPLNNFSVPVLEVSNDLDAEVFQGFVFGNDSGSWLEALQPLYEFHQLTTLEKPAPGQLQINYPVQVSNTSTTLTTIQVDQVLSIDNEPAYNVNDFNKDFVANVLTLTFPDPSLEFDLNSVTVFNSQGSGSNEDEIRFRFSFTRDRAVNGAERMLRSAWTKKQRLEFKLPITEIDDLLLGGLVTLEGDPVMEGKLWSLAELSFSEEFFVNVLVERFNPAIYAYDTDIGALSFIQGDVLPVQQINEVLEFQLIDSPLYKLADAVYLGAYAQIDNGNIGASTYVYMGTDPGNLSLVAQLTKTSPMFFVIGSIPVTSAGLPDYSTSFEIQLFDSAINLSSLTDAEFYQGLNQLQIGREIMAFKTATLTGLGRYRIEGVIRGYRNTEYAIPETDGLTRGTIIQDRDLNPYDIPRLPIDLAFVGQTLSYTMTSDPNGNYDINNVKSFVFQGDGAKALPPSVLAPKYQNGNWIFEWLPISRDEADTLIYDSMPRIGSVEGNVYQVDIYKESELTPLRSTTVTNTTYTYTSGQQTADGYDISQGRLRVVVYQLSNLSNIGIGFESNYFYQV